MVENIDFHRFVNEGTAEKESPLAKILITSENGFIAWKEIRDDGSVGPANNTKIKSGDGRGPKLLKENLHEQFGVPIESEQDNGN